MGRIRKQHSAAYKAKVALEAVTEDKTIAKPAKLHQVHPVHPVRISRWKKQFPDGLEGPYENRSAYADPIPRSSRSDSTSRSAGARWN